MAPVRAALGLDVGTTIVKCLVVDEHGTVLAAARSGPVLVDAGAPGRAEQDPAHVWSAVVSAVRGALETLDGRVTIDGVAVAAASGSVLALGPDARPLTPLFTWMDTRAAPLVARWERDGTASRIRAITGWWPAPGLGLPLVASMREAGALGGRVAIAGLDAFVVHELTGAWSTNPSNAAGLQLMDLRRRSWSAELCALGGVDSAVLPAIDASGSLIGVVGVDAAKATGLGSGVPVFGGAHDQASTALALGLSDVGDVLVSGGTAWVLTTTAESPQLEGVTRGVNVSHHAIDGRWLHSQLLGGFGADLARLADETGAAPQAADEGTGAFAELEAEIDESPPGGDDLLFSGSDFHDAAGRVLVREAALGRPRAERARAVMEHSAYRVNAALEAAGASDVIEVTLVGGAAASHHWPRVLADATGLGVIVASSPSWPATGAALLAATGAGIFESVDTAAARVPGIRRRLEPDPGPADLYRLREQACRALGREEG